MFPSHPHLGRLPAFAAAALTAVAVTALASCTEPESDGPAQITAPQSELAPGFARGAPAHANRAFAALRRATAKYHRLEVALEDGYIRDPLGLVCIPGIGVPFAHPERVPDTEIVLTQPEVLFYEPQKNGTLRLVGSEPVVPIALWHAEKGEDAPPPSLLGHDFHENAEHGLYGLHFWQWLHNPNGRIAFSNPRVSCEFIERTL